MKYKLVSGDSPEILAHAVQRYLDVGYNLHGVPFVSGNVQFHQAVTKAETSNKCIAKGCCYNVQQNTLYCAAHTPFDKVFR